MICIKEIKVVDVDEDFIMISRMEGLPPFADLYPYDDDTPLETVEVTQEMVHGTRFRNSNGLDVCIGMTKQVQDLIGLPFEAFSNMRDYVFKTMGFFGRLKFLFSGYK